MTTPQHTKPTRVLRSRDDRVIAGVCGGLGRYLGIDPVLIRLGAVVLAIAGGAGVLAYLIAWLIIPEESATEGTDRDYAPSDPRPAASGRSRMVAGIVLIGFGIGLLIEWVIPSIQHVFWPLLIIGGGIALIVAGTKR